MAKKNKKLSRPILYQIGRFCFKPFVYFKLGYRYKDYYKIGKDESVVILSNHQTDYDPIVVHYSFNKFIRCLATDNIFSGKATGKFLRYIGTIPKRKGVTDVSSVMEMMKAVHNGDSLLIFPEGNRTFGEFQFPIDKGIVELIKKMKVTLVLFNLHGGFGRFPRMGSKKRKGKFFGEIKSIMKYDEYKDIPNDELYKTIVDTLRVYDSESDELYKSKAKAENFERLFFVCPKCGSLQSIYSKGDHLLCHNCDLDVTYGEDLHFHSDNPSFKFSKLVEWYDYQRHFVLKNDFSSKEVIFEDKNVSMYLANPYVKRRYFAKKVDMKLTNKELIVGDIKINLKDILIASPVSGRKLCITLDGKNYVIRGDKKFNAIKYVFLFNKLDTRMKQEHLDMYYRIED